MKDETDLFDYEADVLVVGSGAAGIAAALSAAQSGASVIVLEKSAVGGGSTALSGGTAWIPNNHLMRARGLTDPRKDALRYLCRSAYPHLYDPSSASLGLGREDFELIEAFYDHGAAALQELCELGVFEAEFDGTTPDYYHQLPENKAPYGRRVPQRSDAELPSEEGGRAMFERFVEVGDRMGIRLMLNRDVWGVLQDSRGQVIGLEIRTGRRTELARARRGVVFASGGFIHNEDLMRRHVGGRVFGGCAPESSTGDFLQIAEDLGAQMGPSNRIWWKQVAVELALLNRTSGPVFLAFGDSMIFVNRYGRRIVNEKAPYHERGQVHQHWDPSRLEYPNLLLFMIWDDAVAQAEYPESLRRTPVPQPGHDAPHVIVADDLPGLTAAIERRLDAIASHTGGLTLDEGFLPELERSIARFNGFAEAGVDTDFGRGSNEIDRARHAPSRPGEDSTTMAPVSGSGPYYCTILGAGALDTCSGPRINVHGQVLDAHASPIPGLYAAGNCASSVTGQAYWGAGGTIGPALTFGYLAGLHAATEDSRGIDDLAFSGRGRRGDASHA